MKEDLGYMEAMILSHVWLYNPYLQPEDFIENIAELQLYETKHNTAYDFTFLLPSMEN